MKIGELAKATKTKVETVRYYEKIGLLPVPERSAGNYRTYQPSPRARLTFIRHARQLGFTIDDIRSLLDLADHPSRDCIDANRIAAQHLHQVKAKISHLTRLRDELVRISGQCRGGIVADCHVIEALSDHRQCISDHL